MTRAHRRWHYRAWVVLAPVILALLFAALARPEATP